MPQRRATGIVGEKQKSFWKYLNKPFFKINKTNLNKKAKGKHFWCEHHLIRQSLTLTLYTVFVQNRLNFMWCGIWVFRHHHLFMLLLCYNIRIENFIDRWQTGKIWASFTLFLLVSWYKFQSPYRDRRRTVGLKPVGICRIVFLPTSRPHHLLRGRDKRNGALTFWHLGSH